MKLLKVKAKVKSGRGSVDPTAIVDAVIGAWDELQSAIGGLTED